MSHPFGNLISQHLHRKHGLSQAKLAAGILQDPAIIGKMCKGQRLTGPQARERVLAVINWLHEQAVLITVVEANALLEAAGMAPLRGNEAIEAALLGQLEAQPATNHHSHPVMARPPSSSRFEHVTGELASASPVLMTQLAHEATARLNSGVSQLARLSADHSLHARPKHNLPAQTTPLLGRAQELAHLAQLLADPKTRLVTILSAGGMGKTHLAVAAAWHQVEHFADGVCWVALAPLTEVNEIVPAIGTALGLQFEGGRTPEQQIGDFMRTKHLLLVLDNFEHLLEGAPFVAELLTKAPQLSLLVTSRQRLKLSSETVLLLDGLSFPANPETDALTFPAVQLFLQHARRVRPRYQPDEQDVAGIVQICRLVDGMPLGILLAAAWTGVISPAEIVAEISKDLGFLQRELHDIPARQRNLRAVFLHTWSRMSIAERTVFMRLSVFRGGVTREAAQRVTDATIEILATLHDKALLWRLPDGRYELHELLRQFAAEQLVADDTGQGEQQREAHSAHSRYYLTLLGEQEGPLQGQAQRAALDLIRGDFENISVAWRWAVQQHEFTLLAPAVHALYLYCEMRGNFHEGVSLFAAAAAELNAAAVTTNLPDFQTLLGQVLARFGACQVMMNSYKSAVNPLEQALQYITTDWEQAFTLAYLGKAIIWCGELSTGQALLRQSLAISQRCQVPELMAIGHYFLANNTSGYREAIRGCEESLALWRQVGRPDRIAEVLGMVAWNTCCLGDYPKAIAYWQEGIAICTTLGMQNALAWTFSCLGWTFWCQGDLATAQSYQQEAAERYRTIGMPSAVGMCLADIALVLRSGGDVEQAVAVARHAVATVRDTEDQMMLVLSLNYLGAALIGAGDAKSARQALNEAIQRALVAHFREFVATAFYYFAELLVLESHGADLPLALERKSLAVALLNCARSQTVTWQIFRDKAAQLQAEIEVELPTAVRTTAIASAQHFSMEEMASLLLQEQADALLDDPKYVSQIVDNVDLAKI